MNKKINKTRLRNSKNKSRIKITQRHIMLAENIRDRCNKLLLTMLNDRIKDLTNELHLTFDNLTSLIRVYIKKSEQLAEQLERGTRGSGTDEQGGQIF